MNKNECKQIKIFIDEFYKVKNVPLYQSIIIAAKQFGMSGATMYRAISGFGKQGMLFNEAMVDNDDTPLIIEIVDNEKNIENFMMHYKDLFVAASSTGLVTISDIQVVTFN